MRNTTYDPTANSQKLNPTLLTPDQPARAVDVKELLAQHDEHEGEALLESYQRAKRHGEIYEYPTDDTEVVKITDEVIA